MTKLAFPRTLAALAVTVALVLCQAGTPSQASTLNQVSAPAPNQAQKADSEKVGGQGTQVKVDVDVDTNTGDELLGLPLDIATPVAEVVAPVVAWVTRTDQDTATKIGVHLLTRQIPYTVAAALATVGAALPWNGVIPGAVLGGLAGALPLGLLGAGLGAINPLNLLGVLPGALLGAPVGA